MKIKKLKDLKKGDSVWYERTPNTTPINVTSVKRTGMVVEIKVQWDEREFLCYGHAFSTKFIGYADSYDPNVIFTTNHDTALRNEEERAYASIGRNLSGIVETLKKL